jgi:hypothetical protein
MDNTKGNKNTNILLHIFNIVIILLIFNNGQTSIFGQDKTKMTEHQQNQLWYKYSPEVYSFIGKVIRQKAYGPPSYGDEPKTDKIVEYYAIVLDQQINVKGDTTRDINTDDCKNIKK